MATFVLIHGSFQTGACWRGVAKELERLGHRALSPDLPAHGSDLTPIAGVSTESYRDAIGRVVASLDTPPVVVGHSMGNPAAAFAEVASESVAGVVFVAGLLPPNGAALVDMLDGFDPAYLAQAIWADDKRSVRISPSGAREFLYAGCPADLTEAAIAGPGLAWEPIAPYEAPLVLSEKSFGTVPRAYIQTTEDKVVLPSIQQATLARMSFDEVFTLACGHSPYYSQPERLAACLVAFATHHNVTSRMRS